MTLTNQDHGGPPVTMTTHGQCSLLEIPANQVQGGPSEVQTNGQDGNPATGTTQVGFTSL